MQLDQWLKEVYEEEVLVKEGQDLEAMFDQMDSGDLLDIACGRTTVEKVAVQKPVLQQPPQPIVKLASPAQHPAPKREMEKASAAKLQFMDKLARQLAHQHIEVRKTAGLQRPEQPTAREVVKGRGPKVRAARAALREKLREGCPVDEKVKEDEFTSPEAQAKAKVLQRAMKATKNAPSSVRKGAIKQVSKQL